MTSIQSEKKMKISLSQVKFITFFIREWVKIWVCFSRFSFLSACGFEKCFKFKRRRIKNLVTMWWKRVFFFISYHTHTQISLYYEVEFICIYVLVWGNFITFFTISNVPHITEKREREREQKNFRRQHYRVLYMHGSVEGFHTRLASFFLASSHLLPLTLYNLILLLTVSHNCRRLNWYLAIYFSSFLLIFLFIFPTQELSEWKCDPYRFFYSNFIVKTLIFFHFYYKSL